MAVSAVLLLLGLTASSLGLGADVQIPSASFLDSAFLAVVAEMMLGDKLAQPLTEVGGWVTGGGGGAGCRPGCVHVCMCVWFVCGGGPKHPLTTLLVLQPLLPCTPHLLLLQLPLLPRIPHLLLLLLPLLPCTLHLLLLLLPLLPRTPHLLLLL